MSSDEDENLPRAQERSTVAAAVEKLREASVRSATERERLPQPLFWSLFKSKVDEIKKEKAAQKALREILG